MERLQRARRIAGIAIGICRAIFRTGEAWGTTTTKVLTRRRPSAAAGRTAPTMAAGFAAGVAGGYFLDPQSGHGRRHMAVDKVASLLRRGTAETDPKPH